MPTSSLRRRFVFPLLFLLAVPITAVADDPPLASIVASATTVEGAQPFTLDGSGSTDDAGIVDYRWSTGTITSFAFDGTTIDASEWQTSGNVSQSGQLNVSGTSTWGANYFYSKTTRPARGSTLEATVRTPTGSSYAMFGFHDTTRSSADYHYLIHAIYFANGTINIYERGSNIGSFGTYVQGSSYDVRIVSRPGGGAAYYWRLSGSGAEFTGIFEGTSDTSATLGIGMDVYAGTWGVDNVRTGAMAFGPVFKTTAPSGATYSLTVEDTLGQTDSDSITITRVTGSAPTASVSGPTTGGVGQFLRFDGSGSTDDYGIAAYAWNFGDGTTTGWLESSSVLHHYTSLNTYTVTLTVRDWAGQTSSAQRSVQVTAANLVKAIPWRLVGGTEIPHDTWSGRSVTLKAVASSAPIPFTWTWSFGDGSATQSGTVASPSQAYALETTHVYTGTDGTPYNATITIRDASGNILGSDTYPLVIRPRNLEVEVNVAIDEGLWYLHKAQSRGTLSDGTPIGSWHHGSYYACGPGSALQAFAINGHRYDGDSSRDPYVETVIRGVNYLMTLLKPTGIGLQTYGSPDANGNGLGIDLLSTLTIYQLGQVMDGIVASCPGSAAAQAGGTNVYGRRYHDLVQDMVDMYAWGQYDHATVGGGWRYNWGDHPDNSASQWAAIGCKAAEDVWGIYAPRWVKDRNLVWLAYSRYATGIGYGYTGAGYGWATSPSGLVQLAWDGVSRSDSRWKGPEDWFADNWSTFMAQNNLYGYYAWTKAMRLQDPPVTTLKTGLDWFLDNSVGMARTLVNRQYSAGYWYDSAWVGSGHLATSWAVIILSSTLFQVSPVAVFTAHPNPGASGIPVQFDASGSYHQDASHKIVEYRWDFDASNGIDFSSPDATGDSPTHTYGALGTYTVTLQVKDDNSPASYDTATLQVRITVPPHPPTAMAGGPYVAAVGESIVLDGSGSFDIDESYGDSITGWKWETDFVHPLDFDDGVTGETPTFSGFGTAGEYDIGLRVTDDTASVFPLTGQPDLTDDAFTKALVYEHVVLNFAARPKATKVQLTWTHLAGGKTWRYQVFRSETGPSQGFALIGTTESTSSTYLDSGLTLGNTYWYRIVAFEVPSGGGPIGDAYGASYATSVTLSARTR